MEQLRRRYFAVVSHLVPLGVSVLSVLTFSNCGEGDGTGSVALPTTTPSILSTPPTSLPKDYAIADLNSAAAWRFGSASVSVAGLGPTSVNNDEYYCMKFEAAFADAYKLDEKFECRLALKGTDTTSKAFASCTYVSDCNATAGEYEFQVKEKATNAVTTIATKVKTDAGGTSPTTDTPTPTTTPGSSAQKTPTPRPIETATFVIIQRIQYANGNRCLNTLTYPGLAVDASLRALESDSIYPFIAKVNGNFVYDSTKNGDKNCTTPVNQPETCGRLYYQTSFNGLIHTIVRTRFASASSIALDDPKAMSSIVQNKCVDF